MKHSHYFIDHILALHLADDLLGLPIESSVNATVERYTQKGIRHVLLDLSGVAHVNSKGLNVLIKTLTHLDDLHGELVIIHASDQVTKLFRITKLNMVFKMAENRSEALAWLSENQNKS